MGSKTNRYRGLVLMLSWLTAAGVLHAQSASEKKVSIPSAPETAKAPADKNPRRVSKPAGTFKPSEKIRADSAVSFPVDI